MSLETLKFAAGIICLVLPSLMGLLLLAIAVAGPVVPRYPEY